MFPFLWLLLSSLLLNILIAQLCKAEDGVESEKSFNIHPDDDISYLLKITEFKSGAISIYLSNTELFQTYEGHIESDSYNNYHVSPTIHQILSSKQFVHYIQISIQETLKQTEYEIIDNRKNDDERLSLHIFCRPENCAANPYDIEIPLHPKQMHLDDTIQSLQHLATEFRKFQKTCDDTNNALTNDLRTANDTIHSLKKQLFATQNVVSAAYDKINALEDDLKIIKQILKRPKYILVTKKMDWNSANKYCMDVYSTTLAIIRSKNDETIAAKMCVDCFIGLKRTDGEWKWLDNTEYIHFATGQPDGNGACTQLWSHGFDDLSCDHALSSFLCNNPFS